MEKYGMKIKVNSLIPFKGYKALTILKWIFVRPDSIMWQRDYTHEAIHNRQQREITLVLFLLIYVLEYIIKLLCTFNHRRAYRSISFEQEAYANEGNIAWPDSRIRYNWKRYIFTLS